MRGFWCPGHLSPPRLLPDDTFFSVLVDCSFRKCQSIANMLSDMHQIFEAWSSHKLITPKTYFGQGRIPPCWRQHPTAPPNCNWGCGWSENLCRTQPAGPPPHTDRLLFDHIRILGSHINDDLYGSVRGLHDDTGTLCVGDSIQPLKAHKQENWQLISNYVSSGIHIHRTRQTSWAIETYLCFYLFFVFLSSPKSI